MKDELEELSKETNVPIDEVRLDKVDVPLPTALTRHNVLAASTLLLHPYLQRL